jgi:hypothetical protein
VEFSLGDTVRIIDPRTGNTADTGKIIAFTAKDRSHVSNRVKGRRLAVIQDATGTKATYPFQAIRKVISDGTQAY